jgi:hypothetical protein
VTILKMFSLVPMIKSHTGSKLLNYHEKGSAYW